MTGQLVLSGPDNRFWLKYNSLPTSEARYKGAMRSLGDACCVLECQMPHGMLMSVGVVDVGGKTLPWQHSGWCCAGWQQWCRQA